MATTLAPVDSREVVRCDRCSLVQFRTTTNMCRRCKLSLDDDVSKYVPEWADHEHHVTIRHLLTHTSGLREGFALLGLAGQSQSNEAMERMLGHQHGVNTAAGTEFVYNNGAYNLLASIVKRVSGQSLRDFAEANISSARTRIFSNLLVDT
jgi:CubicO group peptidase (beta-lactamase class C family)